MDSGGDSGVGAALVRQWELIADVAPDIDLTKSSRVDGWRNADVLAHLYVQPYLLIRFLRSADSGKPNMGVTDNLQGTGALHDLIDSSAREGARLGRFDLGGPLNKARELVLDADPAKTIETVQGSISVSDYLVTRCVEAVVHGRDLVARVTPDPTAESITSAALLNVLSDLDPQLSAVARALPCREWIDVATGRVTITGPLAGVTPLMA
jgi:Mycothiol maleylpyruvate isomerase N-terminal domain